jgi:preprotein translocase subunit SecG
MIILITIVHIIVCLFLIIVVLLQSGKSGDITAAFGGMGSQTAFGPRGAATALSRATTWSAIIFMVTSITLSVAASRHANISKSVLQGIPAQTQPVKPATVPPPPAQK